jgi:arylsulfatase A-like enzyme
LRNRAGWRGEEDRFVAQTITAACQWLEENQDLNQFFLYLDIFDPHEPWDAPKKYLDMYDPDSEEQDIMYPRYDLWHKWYTKAEMDHMRALYMAEVSMVDHWFGKLLDKVEELGMIEDTAIVFCSDHGYLFGEHGLSGKALFLEASGQSLYEAMPMYDEIRRTPLIIRLPGQTSGQHITALVQAPDLMPTFLEMAGLVSTEAIEGEEKIKALQCGVFMTESWQFEPENIHGKSLMPLMRGETSRHRDIAVCSNTLIHHTPVLAKCAVITEDGWCLHYAGKYDQSAATDIRHKGRVIGPGSPEISLEPQLYHLPDDPKESHDLIAKNEALAREIHERYVYWLEEVGTPEDHLEGRRKFC